MKGVYFLLNNYLPRKISREKHKMSFSKLKRSLLIGLIISTAMMGWSFKTQQVDNQTMKSAYVYHLSTYVKWENLPLNDEFIIAVIGKSDDGRISIPNTKKVFGRNVRVIQTSGVEQAERLGARVVYLCSDQAYQLSAISNYVTNRKILTISANRNFLNNGMMVNLLQEQGKVGFELNQKAIRSGNLRFSSQIYSLAKRVLK